jgi:Dolichyl-phosphate-mannose-protein mannosyltransferase
VTDQTDSLEFATGGRDDALSARVLGAVRSVPGGIWALLALAVILRLLIVRYGLPQEFDPDEDIFVRAALRMIRLGTLDPDWYGQPASPFIDGLAALYAAHGLPGVLSGAIDDVAAVFRDYRADASHVLLVGRMFTSIVGVAVVAAAYALARVLRLSTFWAAVAALVVTISVLMVRYSATIRADMLQILFLLLILLVTARSLSDPRARSFVLAGVFLGLAVTSKYPGLIGVVPIVVAAATLVAERRVRVRDAFLWLVLAAIASVIAAFVAGPYLFLNMQGALDALIVEARTEHLGATSQGFVWAVWSYLSQALPEALGVLGTVLGVGGTLAMLADRRARLAALTFWAYLIFIAALSLWWERWVLPLVPLAALGIGFLLDRTEGLVRARTSLGLGGRRLMAARLAVTALLVVPMLIPTIGLVWGRASNDDTRVVAADWVETNIPPGTTLLIETYTPGLRSDRYELLIARDGELKTWQEHRNQVRPGGFYGSLGDQWCIGTGDLEASILERGVDYILVSDSFISRYRAERARYPCESALYERLLATYPAIAVFDHEDAALGPLVTVLAVAPAPEPSSAPPIP